MECRGLRAVRDTAQRVLAACGSASRPGLTRSARPPPLPTPGPAASWARSRASLQPPPRSLSAAARQAARQASRCPTGGERRAGLTARRRQAAEPAQQGRRSRQVSPPLGACTASLVRGQRRDPARQARRCAARLGASRRAYTYKDAPVCHSQWRAPQRCTESVAAPSEGAVRPARARTLRQASQLPLPRCVAD
jgi:hypothetical protein